MRRGAVRYCSPMRSLILSLCLVPGILRAALPAVQTSGEVTHLAATEPLTLQGDIASNLVAGVDRFLLRELEASIPRRASFWQRDFSSEEAYNQSIAPNRKRLAEMLGMRDERHPIDALEYVASTRIGVTTGRGVRFTIRNVRWPSFGDVHGEGLLINPAGRHPQATLIVIPDADQTPEQLIGAVEGLPPQSQVARLLGENYVRLVVPTLIDRQLEKRQGRANLTSREFIYRPSFELGRHLIGYEVQKILSLVDWIKADTLATNQAIGVVGFGEGGGIALYAAALDPRIEATVVSGYFHSRQRLWEEPIDRNVFGVLREFGDAELASMVAPRTLLIEAAAGPQVVLPGEGGAPARLTGPEPDDVRAEVERALALAEPWRDRNWLRLTVPDEGVESWGSAELFHRLFGALGISTRYIVSTQPVQPLANQMDPDARQRRQLHELDRHTQWVLRESPYVRKEFMKNLDTASPEAYQASAERYRTIFREEVIGAFDQPLLPARPRTRLMYDQPTWQGFEVVLDVYPDVIAYGVLLVPKDLKEGERRPVVVCQHGLEGRPRDVIEGDHRAYHDFAAKLAERGFITFAPQNLYLFTDRFRTLQRKANPLGKTLFSIIVPQHQQIVDWLSSLSYVDPSRIAFYGLSYGGKTAMRIPALVTNYCLSICSADFNEWVWKNASTRSPYSYVWTGEYEIFEYNLGSTFNYAEMAALIAPRPFMVERGHLDGVAPDEMVAHEFAKVRHHYAVRLKMPDRCEIEWFDGPHTIHGQGTFDFLHRHLNWPKP